jgi:hypothetical protein
LRKESQDYFDKEVQQTALEKHEDYLQKVKSTPSPQPQQPHHFNGTSNGLPNGNKQASTSPVPPPAAFASSGMKFYMNSSIDYIYKM